MRNLDGSVTRMIMKLYNNGMEIERFMRIMDNAYV